MAKPATPTFVLVTYQALSRKALLALAAEIVAWDCSYALCNTSTNDAIKEMIASARAAYWDQQAAPAPKASPARKSSLCSITAAECNAWLLTLPPTPLAGEA